MIKVNDEVRIIKEGTPSVIGRVVEVKDNEVVVVVPCFYTTTKQKEVFTFKVSANEVVKIVKDGDKLSREHKLDDVIGNIL